MDSWGGKKLWPDVPVAPSSFAAELPQVFALGAAGRLKLPPAATA